MRNVEVNVLQIVDAYATQFNLSGRQVGPPGKTPTAVPMGQDMPGVILLREICIDVIRYHSGGWKKWPAGPLRGAVSHTHASAERE